MWRFAAAQSTGMSHLKVGLPCQDRFACVALPDGTFVAALSDGAGSAAMAECGSRVVVETVIQNLSKAIKLGQSDFTAMLRDAATEARDVVLSEAQNAGVESREFASTLLATVVGPFGGGALQIGDGVIVVSDSDDGEGWSWVFWPQRGEFVNTTRFLTDEDALACLEVEPFAGKVIDIALMSDGLEPLALHYASKSVYAPFFRAMFPPLSEAHGNMEVRQLSQAVESFLSSERVAARTDDDVSLILATRRQQVL